MIKIKEITLLSAEEYKKYSALNRYSDLYSDLIWTLDTWWWTKTAGINTSAKNYAAFIGVGLSEAGFPVESIGSVRPALKLNVALDPFDYNVRDKLELIGLSWTVLDVKGDDIYVLCDTIIAERRFDPETNIWDVSELKSWLEEWLKYMVLGLDDVVYGEVPFDKKPGDICRVGKYDMIVLEEYDGECLLLAKDLYRKGVIFGDTNNFNDSYADIICTEFAKEIEAIVGSENIIERAVDLTSRDGLKDYGKIYSYASLLTEDMYKRYKDIIAPHEVDYWWWLATPWSTPKGTGDFLVSCVSPGGDISNYGCSYCGNCSVRPFCIVKSFILVS